MNFNKILKSLFGDKSSRDMKLIQPLVEKAKAITPKIEAMSNNELRQRTKELQQQVQSSATEQKNKIAELKATIENTPIDERADIFAQIDKIELSSRRPPVVLQRMRRPLSQPPTSTANWQPIPARISSPSMATKPSIIIIGLQAATI